MGYNPTRHVELNTPTTRLCAQSESAITYGSGAGEVYETALDVSVDEFDANVVAHF